MLIARTRRDLREALARAARPVGLVPTMGWLHDGHRSLIGRSRSGNATTVLSIFVNPRQFNKREDFERYPRNEARDLEMCASTGVDVVFIPGVDEVYPPGSDTTVTVGAISRPLEGAARPGHFDGVATVVAILFDLVGADNAYFGLTDYQQLRVIERMAADLAIPTNVVPCPTVRETDGLAMSSRNARLSPEQRAAAPALRTALLAARERWESGERSAEALRAAMCDVLEREPLARIEYVSVADAATLAELQLVDRPALLSLAVSFGEVRLIDNELLG